MTESTLTPDNDDTGGGTSHDADVDAGYDSNDQSGDLLLGDDSGDSLLGGDGVNPGTAESHEADVDAGYDNDSQ